MRDGPAQFDCEMEGVRDGNGFFESSILRDEPGCEMDLPTSTARWRGCEMETVFLKVRICEMNRTTAGQEMNQRDECAR